MGPGYSLESERTCHWWARVSFKFQVILFCDTWFIQRLICGSWTTVRTENSPFPNLIPWSQSRYSWGQNLYVWCAPPRHLWTRYWHLIRIFEGFIYRSSVSVLRDYLDAVLTSITKCRRHAFQGRAPPKRASWKGWRGLQILRSRKYERRLGRLEGVSEDLGIHQRSHRISGLLVCTIFRMAFYWWCWNQTLEGTPLIP